MQMLEMDLKAGLKDSNHDRVLDSIRMLGNIHHLQSEAELISLLDSQDMLVRTFTYQALCGYTIILFCHASKSGSWHNRRLRTLCEWAHHHWSAYNSG
jgi:hypothetical protein